MKNIRLPLYLILTMLSLVLAGSTGNSEENGNDTGLTDHDVTQEGDRLSADIVRGITKNITHSSDGENNLAVRWQQ